MRIQQLFVACTSGFLIAISSAAVGRAQVSPNQSPPPPLIAQGRAIDLIVPPPETGVEAVPVPSIDPLFRGDTRVCPVDLEMAISRVIDHPVFANARWGIDVESLSSQERIYRRHPDRTLIPASNMKLLTAAAALQSLASRNSVLLASRLGETIRFSDNAMANSLLREVGGTTAARRILLSMGVDPGGFYQVDGSGLSRSNSAKPSTLVALLRTMYYSPARDMFYNSLPVAGYSGTLAGRFRGTSVEGKVRAKTGTLTGVRALSGYLEHSEYGPMVFSIVVNQPGQSGTVLVRAIDNVVLTLNRLSRCN